MKTFKTFLLEFVKTTSLTQTQTKTKAKASESMIAGLLFDEEYSYRNLNELLDDAMVVIRRYHVHFQKQKFAKNVFKVIKEGPTTYTIFFNIPKEYIRDVESVINRNGEGDPWILYHEFYTKYKGIWNTNTLH